MSLLLDGIVGVMVSIHASGAVVCGFEPNRIKPKTIKLGFSCFSAKHVALRRKSKDWMARNQNNVSQWGNMSTRGLLFQ